MNSVAEPKPHPFGGAGAAISSLPPTVPSPILPSNMDKQKPQLLEPHQNVHKEPDTHKIDAASQHSF
jgi:hypothetical protein